MDSPLRDSRFSKGDARYMKNIIKRDGTIVPFNKDKIINAINKAFIEVDGQLYEDDTAQDIADEIYEAA